MKRDGRGAGRAGGPPGRAGTPLVGRDADLARLTALLSAEPLVTVVGPVGVGKSRLVDEAVRLQAGATLVHADLADASTAGVDALWDLAEACRVAGGSTLIWLDNCDGSLTALMPLVAELLTRGDVHVVLTSRRPLGSPDETVFRLDPLPGPQAENGAEFSPFDPALRILLAGAPAGPAAAADRAAIVEVCNAAGGLPGLLEHAGRLAGTLGWAEASRRVASDDLPDRGPAGRHTWRKAVDAALDGLSPLEAEVVDRLAVFGPTFSLPAAEEVCADPGLGADEIVEAVVALAEKSVVLVRHGSCGSRYELVAPLREEAVRRLDARSDAALLRRRHSEWAAAWAETAAGRSLAEEANAEVALTWAVQHKETALALRLVAALSPFWCQGGRAGGRRPLVEALAGSASAGAERATALRFCAELAAADGDLAAADRFWQDAYDSWATLGDAASMGRALTARGSIARRLARYEDAGRLLHEGLDLLGRHGGAGGLARSLAELGRLAGLNGEPDTGRMMYREALERHRANGDTDGEATVLSWLADTALVDGHAAEGRRLHEEALRLRRRLGDHRGEAESLTRLAAAAWLADDLKEAARLCGEAAEIQRRVGDRLGLAKTLTTLAHVAYLGGDNEESERLYKAALTVRTQLGDERGAAAAMVGMANALFLRASPDLPAALATATAAADIQRRIGDRRGLAWTEYCLSEMSRDLGDLQSATAHAEESIALYGELGASPRDRCLPAYSLASCRLLAGEVGEAVRLALEALKLASSANGLQRLRCVELAGRVAEASGHDRLAVRLMAASDSLRRSIPGAHPARAGESPRLKACRSRLEHRLGAAFQPGWDEGGAMTLAEAYRAARVGLDSLEAGTAGGQPAAAEWRLRLLGDFELHRAGRPVRLPGAVGEKVVKVVALHGPLPADAVIEMVWPEAPADAARRRLANTMARVRKAAGGVVERAGDLVRLAPSVSIDAVEFKAAAARAADDMRGGRGDGERRARQALALYSGELLPGDRYEDWSAAPRVALSQLRLRLLDELARVCLADGRAREAVDHLITAIYSEPLDVSRHLLAAEILLDNGWRSRARAVLRQAEVAGPRGRESEELAELINRAWAT